MASSTALRKERARKQRRRYRAEVRRAKTGDQLPLELRPTFGWGGKRDRAGRPVSRAKGAVPHRTREPFRATDPLLLSARLLEGILDLRDEPWFDVFVWALRLVANREGVRFVAYSAQGNHLHAILEARDVAALAGAVSAFKGHFTAVANQILGRTGPLFVEGYHHSVLRNPSQVRNAIGYLVENAANHAGRANRLDPRVLRDPFTSLGLLDLRAHRGWGLRAVGPLATVEPTCWLLRTGWQLQ